MKHIVCQINMFDQYQRIMVYDDEKQCSTIVDVVSLDDLPQAIVDRCQFHLINNIRLFGVYPDWEDLKSQIEEYSKTKYGFYRNNDLIIEIN